jgi:tetratricopeptide (TPR) repeat protein
VRGKKGSQRDQRPLFPGLWVALLLFVQGIHPHITLAQNRASENQWQLAEDLLARGQPYRAITEYERFIFYFPEDPKCHLAKTRIVEAYIAGRWWQEGAKEAREALQDERMPGEFKCRLLELLAICLKNEGKIREAQDELDKALNLCPDTEARGRLQVLGARMALEDGKWDEAASILSSMGREGELGEISRELRRASAEERDPHVAGILAALLPGLGHAYLGRWEDAGLVFVVNGAFLAGTLEAIERRNRALAAGMALGELLWYSGNVFSAVSNAHKHNKLLRESWSQRIRPPGDGQVQEEGRPR